MIVTKCHPTRKHYGLGFCASCYQVNWRKHHKKCRPNWLRWQRSSTLKKRYGITLEGREQLKIMQNNKCAICFKEGNLYVDHKHGIKEVRGLLCPRCNTLCGFLETDKGEIEKAREYLSAYEKRNMKQFDDRPKK